MSAVDLEGLVRRLATRSAGRAEATVQSDVRMFLLTAPLGLEEADLNVIVLESPVGDRRRIDVEAGFAVIEVKRDLRTGNVRAEAIRQLGGGHADPADKAAVYAELGIKLTYLPDERQ